MAANNMSRGVASVCILAALTASVAFGGDAMGQTTSVSQTVQLPSPANAIFVLYADHIPEYDVVRSFSTTAWNVPAIHIYGISESDLMQVLGNLTDSGAISPDEEPLPTATIIPDLGDFVYRYGPNPNSPYEYTSARWLQDIEFLEYETEWLNENFRLPYNVTIEAVECDEANAFYIPSEKKVQLCYEYIDNLDVLLQTIRERESYEDLDNFVFDVTYSVLYHEVAHAILDVYDIPYTGLEENVADQFEALMLSRTEGGQDMLYNVGTYYLYSSELEAPTPYWDTHAGNMQRFYNISCWSYGEDPVYNQDLITDGWLPEDRAVWCEEEYDQIKTAFGYLLADYTNGFFD